MASCVLVCGAVFDGVGQEAGGRAEILVRDGRIAAIDRSVEHPDGAEVLDLSERTVCPGFIDTHVHLTMDAAELGRQTLASSSAKALQGLSLAQEYLRYGFTTLRDLGTMDPEFPTVDLRDALNAGLVTGPRLVVAGHVISSSAGHGDMRGFYAPRWDLPVSTVADGRRADQRGGAPRTPTARTGSRPRTPAATSAPATTRPAAPGSTTRCRC
jgi:imidazolonepropionase-like amidohydrolase